MRNTDLFFAIADQIESDPRSYAQETWVERRASAICGKAHCIAGWAVEMSPEAEITVEMSPEAEITDHWLGVGDIQRPVLGGRITDWETAGAQLLGIDLRYEALVLFSEYWEPAEGLSVPDALRKLGGGESLAEISNPVSLEAEGVDPEDLP